MNKIVKVLGIVVAFACVAGVIFLLLLKLDGSSDIEKVDTDYQDTNYYSYEKGDDQFVFLNMNKLIIVGQKNTSFMIEQAEDKEEAILSKEVAGLSFQKGKSSLDVNSEDGVTTAKVISNVVVDGLKYGEYCGQLVNISRGDVEWTLFVGAPGDRYDYLTTYTQNEIEKLVDVFKNHESMDSVAYKIFGISDDSLLTEDSESEEITNQIDDMQKLENRAYESSIKDMLSIGINGLVGTFNELNKNPEGKYSIDEPIVCPEKIYTGSEAVDMIKQYCEDTEYYDYFTCQDGCSWEVLEYSVNYKNCDYRDYINVRIKGLDGSNLKYRGIEYSPRSYDINNQSVREGDWSRKCRVYYAVPNGCYEYCLVFGDADYYQDTDRICSAYYHINNKEVTEETTEESTLEEETQDGE